MGCTEAWHGWAGLLPQGVHWHLPSVTSSGPPTPGPSLSCFHWPRSVQACARLQQLLEWTRGAGCGEAAEGFFRKLCCTLDLLATPSAQLIQVGGPGWAMIQGRQGTSEWRYGVGENTWWVKLGWQSPVWRGCCHKLTLPHR